MRDACLTDVPDTIIGRAEATEKRVDTILQAVRTMRPALEVFYETLSDEQETRLESNDGRGRFGHWRDRWQTPSSAARYESPLRGTSCPAAIAASA